MSDKEVLKILSKVQSRVFTAWKFYLVDAFDCVEKELLELRDVLDDIYDRPEEDINESEPIPDQ